MAGLINAGSDTLRLLQQILELMWRNRESMEAAFPVTDTNISDNFTTLFGKIDQLITLQTATNQKLDTLNSEVASVDTKMTQNNTKLDQIITNTTPA